MEEARLRAEDVKEGTVPMTSEIEQGQLQARAEAERQDAIKLDKVGAVTEWREEKMHLTQQIFDLEEAVRRWKELSEIRENEAETFKQRWTQISEHAKNCESIIIEARTKLSYKEELIEKLQISKEALQDQLLRERKHSNILEERVESLEDGGALHALEALIEQYSTAIAEMHDRLEDTKEKQRADKHETQIVVNNLKSKFKKKINMLEADNERLREHMRKSKDALDKYLECEMKSPSIQANNKTLSTTKRASDILPGDLQGDSEIVVNVSQTVPEMYDSAIYPNMTPTSGSHDTSGSFFRATFSSEIQSSAQPSPATYNGQTEDSIDSFDSSSEATPERTLESGRQQGAREGTQDKTPESGSSTSQHDPRMLLEAVMSKSQGISYKPPPAQFKLLEPQRRRKRRSESSRVRQEEKRADQSPQIQKGNTAKTSKQSKQSKHQAKQSKPAKKKTVNKFGRGWKKMLTGTKKFRKSLKKTKK